MRIELDEYGAVKGVVLSKRNLLALLEKLQWNSKRTIVANDKGRSIAISAEPDEVHYFNRPEPPGIMIDGKGNIY